MKEAEKIIQELEGRLNVASARIRANEQDIQKYRLVGHAMNIGLWEMDIVGGDAASPDNAFFWSQEIRDMLGFFDEKDFPNELGSWSSRLHPEDYARTLLAFDTHVNDITGKTPYDVEYRLQVKSGEYRYFRDVGAASRDEAGNPFRVAGALKDITETKQLQLALQSALEKSRKATQTITSILNQSGAMIYVVEPETDAILFMSDAMKQHYGVDDAVLGSPCYRVFQEGAVARCDLCLCPDRDKDPDKVVMWEDSQGKPGHHIRRIGRHVEWPDGQKVRIQYLADLTEFRRAEQTLRHRESLLDAFNQMDVTLMSQKDKTFDDAMSESLRPIADAAHLDRIDIYSFVRTEKDQRLGQVYRWIKARGALTYVDDSLRVLPYLPAVDNWIDILSKGDLINIHSGIATAEESAFLAPLNVKSLLFLPVYINDALWGAVAFQDFSEDRLFDDDSISFLNLVARLCGDAIIKNQLKEELSETQNRVSLMIESAPLSCQLWNSSLQKIDCNAEAVRLFGFRDKADYLERYREIYPEYQPDGQNSVEKAQQQLRMTAEEGRSRFIWTYRMLDGSEMPAEVIMVKVDHGDDFAIAGYTRDLREHNRMIAEISQRTEELSLQRTTLQTIIDSIPDIVFCKDPDFRYTLFNSAALDFLDVDMADALGKTESEFGFPDEVEEAIRIKDQSVFDGMPKVVHNYGLAALDGSMRYFETTKAPLVQDDAVIGLVGVARDVTEVEERERALKHAIELNELQLAKLDLVVRGARIGLWDTEFVNEDYINPLNPYNWSDDIREVLGYTDEKDFPNVLSSWSDRLHPEDKERASGAYLRHLLDRSGRTPYDEEFRLLRKDGQYAYFRGAGEALRDEYGIPVRGAGAMMDITESRRMTQALNEAVLESKRTIDTMSSILNNIDSMIYVSERETQEILFVNSFMKQHYQLDDDVIGQPCYAIFHPGRTRKCEWCPGNLLEKEPDRAIFWESHNSITNRHYRNIDRFIDWPGGKKVHIQHCVDVTDFVQMQADLGHSQAMLHAINSAATQLLNADIDTFEDTLYGSMQSLAQVLKIDRIRIWKNDVVDGELVHSLRYELAENPVFGQGEEVFVNIPFSETLPGWEAVLSAGGFINTLVRDLPPVEKVALSRHNVLAILVIPVFSEEQFWGFVGFDNCTEERRFTENEESILWSASVLFVNACIRNEILKSLRDTSTQLESALVEAQSANRVKGEFLRTVSHEIRTPMNAILGMTEIQLQADVLTGDVREAFETIYTSGEVLLGIINDILDMSKIEAGRLEVVTDTYEAASLIIDTVQTNVEHLMHNPIEFNLYVDENIPVFLNGDPLRIRQVLNNLLSNAFKYTEKGSVDLSFRAESDSGDDAVTLVIDIRDTGVGMTQEQMSRVFDTYTRFHVDGEQMVQGTGLGMSIVKNLLDLMDGQIEMESEPGKGSRFTVRLPQTRVGADVLGEELARSLQRYESYESEQAKRARIFHEPMPYGKVLIVDDVESNIRVARGLMTPYGLNIETTTSGSAAIKKIESGGQYDVIFMDHMMPKMDGIEATRIIREKGYTLPIVALTANATTGQSETFLASGFDEFISKPIDIRLLNSVLNKFVRDKYLAIAPDTVRVAREQAEKRKTAQQSTAKVQDVRDAVNSLVVEVFIRDASRALSKLEAINSKSGPWSEKDKKAFEVHVHGMKSALAIIGKTDLSAVAYKLEMADHDVDVEQLRFDTAEFLESLRAVIEGFSATKPARDRQVQQDDWPYLHEKLRIIKVASGQYDANTVTMSMRQLRERTWSESTQEMLVRIGRHALASEFEEIIDVVDGYFEATDPEQAGKNRDG